MTSSNPADTVTYHVVVEGLDPEAQQITMRHFQTKRGGARPHDLSLYVSIPADPEQVENIFSWLVEALTGRFKSFHIGACINTKLNWAELTVPSQLLLAASRYGAQVKVLFSSPVQAVASGVSAIV